jgi:hypothetical protein
MKRLLLLALLAAFAPLAACSFHSDVETFCNVETLSGATGLPPDRRATMEGKYLESHIHSSKGKELFMKLGTSEKAAAMRAAAKAEGVSPCPLADQYEKKEAF